MDTQAHTPAHFHTHTHSPARFALWLLLLHLLAAAHPGVSLRITETVIPVYKIRGEDAELNCRYDLEGDPLYSVKWYKDDEEFYRYMPGSESHKTQSVFKRPGVEVNTSKCNASKVVLTGLDFKSSGLYRCEISIEDSFNTLNRFGRMMVVELPKKEPEISGVRDKYVSGDTLRANCTAGRSHPAAQLRWTLNDQPVPRKYIFSYAPVQHEDELETSILGLNLPLKDHHFSRGVIHLRCIALVAALDTRSDHDFSQVEGDHAEPIVLEQRRAQVRVNGAYGLPTGVLSLLLPLLLLLMLSGIH